MSEDIYFNEPGFENEAGTVEGEKRNEGKKGREEEGKKGRREEGKKGRGDEGKRGK
jgi:hypothetical protein